jgi:hypothetical protein
MRPGLCSLANFSLDDARANMQAQAIDGRILRQREDIYSLKPCGGVVAEFLQDPHALNQTVGVDLDLGREGRGHNQPIVLRGFE